MKSRMKSRMKSQVIALVSALALAVTVAGCASSGKSGSEGDAGGTTTTATAGRPEDQRTSEAVVAAGLQKIDETVKQLATFAGVDKAQATKLTDGIEDDWAPIEGTVRGNDADA